MKRTFTKFLTLLGLLLCLGVTKSYAATLSFYYDPSEYNRQYPNKPITSISYTVYSMAYGAGNNWKPNITGEMTWDTETNLWVVTDSQDYAGYGFQSVVITAKSDRSNIAIVNNGSSTTSTYLTYLQGVIYSYNTTAGEKKRDKVANYSKNMGLALGWYVKSGTSFEYVTADKVTVQVNDQNLKMAAIENISVSELTPSYIVKLNGVEVGDEYYTPVQAGANFYVQFKKPGKYTVVGSSSGIIVGTTKELTVNVVNVEAAETIDPQAWSADGLTFTISKPLPSGYDASDFTVTVTPQFSTSGSGVLETWQEAQMQGIMNANGTVDGAYPSAAPSYTVGTDSNNELTVIGNFPTSGVYEVNLTYTGSDDFYSNFPVEVTVYPNVTLSYSGYVVEITNDKGQTETTEVNYKDGLNINGMQASFENGSGTIEYYYETRIDGSIEWFGSLEEAVLYTPGTYFETIRYYISTEGNVQESDITNWSQTTEQSINISELSKTSPLYLYIILEKNGASSPMEMIKINKTNSVLNIPTSVEAIDGDTEGEAVYYNLQGVKVANPEHGIFVKVAGGKASKVVL